MSIVEGERPSDDLIAEWYRTVHTGTMGSEDSPLRDARYEAAKKNLQDAGENVCGPSSTPPAVEHKEPSNPTDL
jgi:hypothetical protein